MSSNKFMLVSSTSQKGLDEFFQRIRINGVFDNNRRVFSNEILFCSSELNELIVLGTPYSSDVNEITSAEVEFCVGNFSYIKIDESGILVGSDFFGLSINYIYQDKDIIAVSNCLELLVNAFGEDFSFNPIYSELLNYLSPEVVNWQITNEFVVSGLTRMELGYEYKISKGSASKYISGINKPFDPSQYAYETLIALAFDEVRRNIKVMSHLVGEGQDIDIDLSGGKDSRLVLSIAETIPEVKKRLKIVAKDVPGDLDVALVIVEKRNLEFKSKCTLKRLYKISFDEVFEKWIKTYAGEYCRLGMPTLATFGEEVENKLSGGCGEAVTRSANVEWLRKSESICFIDSLKEQLCRYSYGKKDITPRLSQYIDKNFSVYSDLEKGEALNKYYLNFRNRVHFGKNEVSNYIGENLFFPLLSRNLYYASMLLNERQIYGAKIIYDLMDKATPELLDIPFSSNFPYLEEVQKNYSLRDEVNPDVRDEWEKSNLKLAESRRQLISIKSNQDPFEKDIKTKEMQIETLYRRGLDAIFTLNFVSNESLDLDTVLSSYYKSFFTAERCGIYFSTYLCGLAYLFSKVIPNNLEFSSPYYALPPKRPDLDIKFENDERKILKVTLEDSSKFEKTEYAFYFYVKGECTNKIWYSKNDTIDIAKLGLNDKKFSVKVFVRNSIFKTSYDFDF